MIRELGYALAAGLLSAVLFLLVPHGGQLGVLLSYLAPAPLLAVGLGAGATATAIAGVVAALAVTIDGGSFAGTIFALLAVLPSVIVVRQALLWRKAADGIVEWYPAGRLLGLLAAYATALILLAAALSPSHAAGFEGVVREYLGRVTTALPPVLAGQMDAVIDMVTPLFPAMVAGVWLTVMAANGALAQWAAQRLGRNRRPAPAYAGLDLPTWMAVVTAACLLATFLGGGIAYLGRNLVALLLVAYALTGVSVIHAGIRRRPNGGVLLGVFYAFFFLASVWVVVAAAGLGLVRHWIGLGRRLAGRSQEDRNGSHPA